MTGLSLFSYLKNAAYRVHQNRHPQTAPLISLKGHIFPINTCRLQAIFFRSFSPTLFQRSNHDRSSLCNPLQNQQTKLSKTQLGHARTFSFLHEHTSKHACARTHRPLLNPRLNLSQVISSSQSQVFSTKKRTLVSTLVMYTKVNILSPIRLHTITIKNQKKINQFLSLNAVGHV